MIYKSKMIKKGLFCLIFYLIILNIHFVQVNGLDSYSILGLSQMASDTDIQKQYKKLRGKYRKNRAKKNKIKRAYDNIVVQRTFRPKKSI